MIERDSFAFRKNKAKNKIKIKTLVFINGFVNIVGFNWSLTFLFNN